MPKEGKAKVLTESELKRVLKVALAGKHAKRNIALLYVSFGLGLRVKEITALNMHHVLDGEGQLLEEINLLRSMTKGEKQRHIYLTNSKVRKAVEEYVLERKEQDGLCFSMEAPLFRSQWKLRFSPNSLQQIFQKLYQQAGIVGASSHSGRRTFATRLIEQGIDIKAVSRLMGHATIAMTAQYVEDNPVRLRRIAEAIDI